MKVRLSSVTTQSPRFTMARTNAVFSSANWKYNQTGQQYNAVGVQYGGSDRKQDIGPNIKLVSDI